MSHSGHKGSSTFLSLNNSMFTEEDSTTINNEDRQES